ncbi:DUF4142 domain-containing protein [Burkholderia sp. Bp9126]|nr:DUF4142 domain-containing protein [Burkholderia sp. Bp9126]
MEPNIRIIAALAAAALGLAAAVHAQTPSEPAATNPRTPPELVKPAPEAGDTRDAARARGMDADFVDKAELAGKSEVDASRLALDKSTSRDVRAFAQRMIDDHGKANERLQKLAVREGASEPSARPVDPDVEALRNKSGHDFDVAYVAAAGPDAHQKAVRLFEDEARGGHDAGLRAFATATLPTLRHHLTMAQALARKVGAQ